MTFITQYVHILWMILKKKVSVHMYLLLFGYNIHLKDEIIDIACQIELLFPILTLTLPPKHKKTR